MTEIDCKLKRSTGS